MKRSTKKILDAEYDKEQIEKWATSLRYFRFVRSYGGMSGGPDELLLKIKYANHYELTKIITLVNAKQANEPNSLYGDPAEKVSIQTKNGVVCLSGWVSIEDCRVYANLFGSYLWLSLTDEKTGYLVTDKEIELAQKMENKIELIEDFLVDPPKEDINCFSPRHYPHLWKNKYKLTLLGSRLNIFIFFLLSLVGFVFPLFLKMPAVLGALFIITGLGILANVFQHLIKKILLIDFYGDLKLFSSFLYIKKFMCKIKNNKIEKLELLYSKGKTSARLIIHHSEGEVYAMTAYKNECVEFEEKVREITKILQCPLEINELNSAESKFKYQLPINWLRIMIQLLASFALLLLYHLNHLPFIFNFLVLIVGVVLSFNSYWNMKLSKITIDSNGDFDWKTELFGIPITSQRCSGKLIKQIELRRSITIDNELIIGLYICHRRGDIKIMETKENAIKNFEFIAKSIANILHCEYKIISLESEPHKFHYNHGSHLYLLFFILGVGVFCLVSPWCFSLNFVIDIIVTILGLILILIPFGIKTKNVFVVDYKGDFIICEKILYSESKIIKIERNRINRLEIRNKSNKLVDFFVCLVDGEIVLLENETMNVTLKDDIPQKLAEAINCPIIIIAAK
jgi:hypothetical protein